MENKPINSSPDMVRFASVLQVITNRPSAFKNEKSMADIVRDLNSLQKYDYHPVADTITNNNTTINVIAEESKVRDLIASIKERSKQRW